MGKQRSRSRSATWQQPAARQLGGAERANSGGQRFVHRGGRPFTAQETELIGIATEEDMRAAAANWLPHLTI